MLFQRNKFIISLLFLFFVLLGSSFAQTPDIDAIKKAATMKDPVQKIEALKQFIRDYPESSYGGIAKANIFSAFLDLGKVDSALFYVSQYFEIIPPELRMNPYNEVAYTLAQKKVGLDSADVYSARAIDIAKNTNSPNLSMYQDTRALVLYDLGKFADALNLEKQAVVGHETDPSYLLNLAIFEEGAGKKSDAINTAAQAVINGDNDQALVFFNKWVEQSNPTKGGQEKLKSEVASSVLKKYFEDNKGTDKVRTESNAAVFLSQLGVNLSQAEKWAKTGVSSLKSTSDLDDLILYKKNLAMVYFAENKFENSLKELKSVEEYVDPWDFDYWYTLGSTYEKLGQNNSAIDSYISGIIAFQNQKITAALFTLAKKNGINENAIGSMIEKRKEELASFNPGHFNKKSTGKVVLAELFTGAECGPCAGADAAFDALSEYYPRTDLAILEYHVHIPAPDPMTNPQSFQRYKYYGGNFGTPTVFFNGTEKLTGGGPKLLLKNRFNVYNYIITQMMHKKPEITFTGSADLKDSLINVNLDLKGKSKTNTSLHLALVEKSIRYFGSNGVTKHLFVVRSLIGLGDDIKLKLKNNSEKFNETFNLNEIQNTLSKYLDNPTSDPSWRANVKFAGWRARTDIMDRKNLAVVAWVQDNSTKEILQSYYTDLLTKN